MTENKRFTLEDEELCIGIKDGGEYISVLDLVSIVNIGIKDRGEYISVLDLVSIANEQHETIQRLKKQLNYLEYRFFEYRNKKKILTEEQVNETLQKHYKQYTNMAVELRHDKYANGACHDVLEVLEEIADELGVDLE